MGLTGYTRTQERPQGGLSEVWLVAANQVESCTYDAGTGVYTSVVLSPGAFFEGYEFLEDTASYCQGVHGEFPHISVWHELAFSLARADAASSSALSSLVNEVSGVVAVVRTSCGEAFLAGWSPEFEQECPLKPASVVWSSGSEYAQDSECVITLRAVDISFSKPFTGIIPRRNVGSKHIR